MPKKKEMSLWDKDVAKLTKKTKVYLAEEILRLQSDVRFFRDLVRGSMRNNSKLRENKAKEISNALGAIRKAEELRMVAEKACDEWRESFNRMEEDKDDIIYGLRRRISDMREGK